MKFWWRCCFECQVMLLVIINHTWFLVDNNSLDTFKTKQYFIQVLSALRLVDLRELKIYNWDWLTKEN